MQMVSTFYLCGQITRRYAEFSGAVMVLHEKFPLEGVDSLMLQLQDEVEKVILKMAAVFHNRKDQLIFLINNYDMMLSVLSVSVLFHHNTVQYLYFTSRIFEGRNCTNRRTI